jgi:signal transduction histidine kinase
MSSLAVPAPEVADRLRRIQTVERNFVLPLRLFAIAIIFYSLQQSPWFGLPLGSLEITVTTVNTLFAIYLVASVLGAGILLLAEHLPFPLVQWSVFAGSLVDGIFVGALTLVSGGSDSPLFWLFLVLIVRNAASHPPVWSQLVLNLCMAACFAAGGLLGAGLNRQINDELYGRPMPHIQHGAARTNAVAAPARALPQPSPTDAGNPAGFEGESETEAIVVRLVVLGLASVWLYAVQVLLEKQRLAADEAREFSDRESQLRAAGRLAAEFAHQIKNPLAILNNAAFSLERGLKSGKGDPERHLRIIQEEISRADRIIMEVMGYAELTEGRVEKLDLSEEIRRALAQSFPEGLAPEVKVKLDLRGPFPPMLMQRRHLSESLLNLLLNAREVLAGRGEIRVSARVRPDLAVEVMVADNGPGIPPEKLEHIFEPYFTTKQRGTGLGLAIVKNNVELYGGSVRAESELGKGARFTLIFPAKASLKLGP